MQGELGDLMCQTRPGWQGWPQAPFRRHPLVLAVAAPGGWVLVAMLPEHPSLRRCKPTGVAVRAVPVRDYCGLLALMLLILVGVAVAGKLGIQPVDPHSCSSGTRRKVGGQGMGYGLCVPGAWAIPDWGIHDAFELANQGFAWTRLRESPMPLQMPKLPAFLPFCEGEVGTEYHGVCRHKMGYSVLGLRYSALPRPST